MAGRERRVETTPLIYRPGNGHWGAGVSGRVGMLNRSAPCSELHMEDEMMPKATWLFSSPHSPEGIHESREAESLLAEMGPAPLSVTHHIYMQKWSGLKLNFTNQCRCDGLLKSGAGLDFSSNGPSLPGPHVFPLGNGEELLPGFRLLSWGLLNKEKFPK